MTSEPETLEDRSLDRLAAGLSALIIALIALAFLISGVIGSAEPPQNPVYNSQGR